MRRARPMAVVEDVWAEIRNYKADVEVREGDKAMDKLKVSGATC